MATHQQHQQRFLDRFNALVPATVTMSENSILMPLKQALASPSVYHFSELLTHPAVAALDEGSEVQRLIRLFSFGTWSDYHSNSNSNIELSDALQRKLKLLTLVSLVNEKFRLLSSSHSMHHHQTTQTQTTTTYHKNTKSYILPFSDIQNSFETTTETTVEEIILEALEDEIISGKIDQKNRCIHVDGAIARDVSFLEDDDEVDSMIASCSKFYEKNESIIQDLVDLVEKHTNTKNQEEKKMWFEVDEMVVGAAASSRGTVPSNTISKKKKPVVVSTYNNNNLPPLLESPQPTFDRFTVSRGSNKRSREQPSAAASSASVFHRMEK